MSVLAQPALVLNKSWVAITTTTVRRALSLLYTGDARAIEVETYQPHDFESWSDLSIVKDQEFVQTVHTKIRVPEVILLTQYNSVPEMTVVFSRRNLYRRDNYTCQYCGAQPGTEELTIDHVLPRSKGGKSTWENCVISCIKCNHKKANRTPREAGMILLTKPKKPSWTPMMKIGTQRRKVSWEKFLSDKYWDIKLEE